MIRAMHGLGVTLALLALVACGGKKAAPPEEHDKHGEHGEQADHDEHGDHDDHGKPGDPHDDHGKPGDAHDDHDAAGGVVRILPEMLRDLRVTIAPAEARPAGERVSALAELGVNQDAYAEVAALAPARVTRVLVGLGDTVTSGQPLVELHSVELGRARAEVAAARVRAESAAASLARTRELEGDKLVPARELRDAEAAARAADAELRVAQAAMRALGEGASGETGRLVLRAPLAGTVIARDVVTGQLADPARTLLRIGDLSTLWLTAHVFERDAVRVTTGGRADVAFAALPGRTFTATIDRIGHEVEPASRTIPVRLQVPNREGLLRPGMSATVSLPLGDEKGTVVAVPIAAVQRVGDGWAVFSPSGTEGVFTIRPIGRGRELGGEVEVLSGLKAGETVVVDGAFLLKAEADKQSGQAGGHDHAH